MTHCLRPEFTASLRQRLLIGNSINLISPHGYGRRRTLQDLRRTLPVELKIFHINMKDYQFDYKGFIHDLYSQLDDLKTPSESFNALLGFIAKKNQQSLFILHNFDILRHPNSTISGYNIHFLQTLNQINKYNNITLLCVSETEHEHYILQADGSALSGSKLEAESITLPPMTFEQTLAEMHRRKLPHSKTKLRELAMWILQQSAPYSTLNKLAQERFISEL